MSRHVETYAIPVGSKPHRCHACGRLLYKMAEMDLEANREPTATLHGYGIRHHCPGRHE